MKVLLIYSQLRTGGIEMLLVRMANWFVRYGHHTSVLLTSKDGELLDEIDKNVKIFYPKTGKANVFDRVVHFLTSFSEIKDKTYDLIYTYQPEGLLISYVFKTKRRLMGVYHQDALARPWRKLIISELDEIDPNWYRKVVFPSVAAKLYSEAHLKRTLPGFLFPIPVSFSEKCGPLGNNLTRKVVSIGRLVDFKTYNFYMLDVIEKLSIEFPDVSYHIYGYGPEEDRLRKMIYERGLNTRVFLHGLAEHSKYKSYLKDASVFVGMGTAMIEASYFGVPSIVAVANDMTARTYGFFHEIQGYECGESIFDREPQVPVLDKILEIFRMSNEQYIQHCLMAQRKADEFNEELVMSEFLRNVEKMPEDDLYLRCGIEKIFLVKLKHRFYSFAKQL